MITQFKVRTVNRWVVALSVTIGSLMAAIDSSIVNVALPHIRGSVGVSIEEITCVSTAYIIAMVMVMPLVGLLGAIFGQKRLYLYSLIVFVAGSLFCATAQTLPALVFFRILQGLGAGALQPSQQAILRQTFPQSEQGIAMAIFSMVILVGPALGPTLGGWITDTYSWPWIFLINLPIGMIGIYLTLRNVHDSPAIKQANNKRAKELKANMDWIGIFLLFAVVGSLQYVLEEGQSSGWFESQIILGFVFVCIFSLCLFFVRELTFPHPVIKLHLFKNPAFLSATVVSGLVFACITGGIFLLPLFTQELLKYDATISGLVMMPRTVTMLIFTPIVGRLYNRVSSVTLISIGGISFIIGNFLLSKLNLQSSPHDITTPMVIIGMGLAFLTIPLNTMVLSVVDSKDASDAAGLSAFVRQIGASAGLSIFVSLLGYFSQDANSSLASQVSILRFEVQDYLEILINKMHSLVLDYNLAKVLAFKIINEQVANQSMVLAFEKAFLLQAVGFLFIFPLLFFLRGRKGTKQITHTHID